MDEETDTWEPPSDAEMKIVQARRERADKISSIMGEYLLKGYKMLNSVCETCGTILLQDKQSQLYCVACSEVDSAEHAKDDPALSDAAARRQVEESHYQGSSESSPSVMFGESQTSPVPQASTTIVHCHSLQEFSLPPVEEHGGQPTVNRASAPVAPRLQTVSSVGNCFEASETALKEKMTWASRQLRCSQSIDDCRQLCALIKQCAETLIAIRHAKSIYGSSG